MLNPQSQVIWPMGFPKGLEIWLGQGAVAINAVTTPPHCQISKPHRQDDIALLNCVLVLQCVHSPSQLHGICKLAYFLCQHANHYKHNDQNWTQDRPLWDFILTWICL